MTGRGSWLIEDAWIAFVIFLIFELCVIAASSHVPVLWRCLSLVTSFGILYLLIHAYDGA